MRCHALTINPGRQILEGSWPRRDAKELGQEGAGCSYMSKEQHPFRTQAEA